MPRLHSLTPTGTKTWLQLHDEGTMPQLIDGLVMAMLPKLFDLTTVQPLSEFYTAPAWSKAQMFFEENPKYAKKQVARMVSHNPELQHESFLKLVPRAGRAPTMGHVDLYLTVDGTWVICKRFGVQNMYFTTCRTTEDLCSWLAKTKGERHEYSVIDGLLYTAQIARALDALTDRYIDKLQDDLAEAGDIKSMTYAVYGRHGLA